MVGGLPEDESPRCPEAHDSALLFPAAIAGIAVETHAAASIRVQVDED
jgi:hypothetical protein